MFGKMIDYRLLRLCAHGSNTEPEELRQLERDMSIESVNARFEKLNRRLDNEIPTDSDMRYLEIGCGMGDISLALAQRGCRLVTGIDKDPYYIEIAKRCAEKMQLQDKVTFKCMNVHDIPNNEEYDIILSHEMLEHVERPGDCLRRIDGALKSSKSSGEGEGRIILAFGPLFHSPLGGHVNRFFRFRIPWIAVLFSEDAIMRLRHEFWRPLDDAEVFEDVREGLNKMKFSEFLRYVEEAGWITERLIVNPQLKRLPALWRLSNLLLRAPLLRDYIAISVYAIYRRQ